MFWEIEKEVHQLPLAHLTLAKFDIYKPVDLETEKQFFEDINSNGQITNLFITEDNIVIAGLRIYAALKANKIPHAKVQRVKIKPEFHEMFNICTNRQRFRTTLDAYKEVNIIYETIERHQGKKMFSDSHPILVAHLEISHSQKIETSFKESETTSHQPHEQLTKASCISIGPTTQQTAGQSQQQTNSLPQSITENTQIIVENKATKTFSLPIQTSISQLPITLPEIQEVKAKDSLSPLEKAIAIADNEITNTTKHQRIKFVETVDQKYGTRLLEMFDTKCPNIDKIYKAAKLVDERSKQKTNPLPALVISTAHRQYEIFNKSNQVMIEIEDGSIDFVLTSNPYWNQIDYNQNNAEQLGQEPTVDMFITNLIKSYAEVYKKMAPTGNLFVNIKDTYGNNGSYFVEEKFKIAMGQSRWQYRGDYIWLKKGGGKRSGKRASSPENCYEKIFWFTKTSSYYYRPIQIPNNKVITATFKPAETRIESKGVSCHDKIDVSLPFSTFKNVIEETNFLEVVVTNSAAADSRFMNELYGKHPAPFSMALALPFQLQFCPPNGRVLEPFLGRGAGLVSALMLGHSCYGYEIEPEFYHQSQKLLADVVKDIDYYRHQMLQLQRTFDDKFNRAA